MSTFDGSLPSLRLGEEGEEKDQIIKNIYAKVLLTRAFRCHIEYTFTESSPTRPIQSISCGVLLLPLVVVPSVGNRNREDYRGFCTNTSVIHSFIN